MSRRVRILGLVGFSLWIAFDLGAAIAAFFFARDAHSAWGWIALLAAPLGAFVAWFSFVGPGRSLTVRAPTYGGSSGGWLASWLGGTAVVGSFSASFVVGISTPPLVYWLYRMGLAEQRHLREQT